MKYASEAITQEESSEKALPADKLPCMTPDKSQTPQRNRFWKAGTPARELWEKWSTAEGEMAGHDSIQGTQKTE